MGTNRLGESCGFLAKGLAVAGMVAASLLSGADGRGQAQSSPKDAGMVRLTLQQDLSSKLPNGACPAVDGAGRVYTGYVATKRAKWFHGLWNRGTIRLVFDQPMQIVSAGGKSVKKNGEAPARTGTRVMQAAEIGVSYSVAKIIDDAYLDEPYGLGPTKAILVDIANRRADRRGATRTAGEIESRNRHRGPAIIADACAPDVTGGREVDNKEPAADRGTKNPLKLRLKEGTRLELYASRGTLAGPPTVLLD